MASRRAPAMKFLALGVVIGLSVGCGSRTPLDVDPTKSPGVTVKPGDADDAGIDFAQCFTESRNVGEIPIDLYFMMDKSTSMNTIDIGSRTTRWAAVSAAMKSFITSPISAGLGAGLAFFPRVDTSSTPLCGASDYALPVVPIGTLPTVVPSISTGINVQTLGTGTPTTPALQGAHIYARSRQMSQPGRVAAVVLVTDGEPRGCSSSIPGTSAVALQAAGGNPSIKTYVLGVGRSLSALDAIAEAGGTQRAYLVESGGQAELTAALDAIRTSAQSCAYVIPEKGRRNADLDPAKVETRTGPEGAAVRIHQVASAEACGGGPGWFYDVPPSAGESTPTRILLCPASCDPLARTSGSRLDVTIGCGDASAP